MEEIKAQHGVLYLNFPGMIFSNPLWSKIVLTFLSLWSSHTQAQNILFVGYASQVVHCPAKILP